MNILGLHFGHDGAACVVRDGRLASYVLRERHSRVKHAIGVTRREIDLALDEAGLAVDDLDWCAISSTQNMELLVGLAPGLAIGLDAHPDCAAFPSPFPRSLAAAGVAIADRQSASLARILSTGKPALQYAAYSRLCPEREAVAQGRVASVGWIDTFLTLRAWTQGRTLEEIAASDASPLLAGDEARYGFHLPVTVALDGWEMPGVFVQHHVAHAASCFYRSGFDTAAIVTHDGFGSGTGYQSGLVVYGSGRELHVLSPHHLAIGSLYDHTALLLDLHAGGVAGMQGKLMGLAPYGQPAFHEPGLVGNWFDAKRRFGESPVATWLRHCRERAAAGGYDLSALGVKERMTEPVNADIAASAQRLFEESYLAAVRAARGLLAKSGIAADDLCLTGGTALNCPTNTRLHRESGFRRLYVEPSCSDDGLAIGAALYLHHHLLGAPVEREPGERYATPYLGVDVRPAEIEAALARHADRVDVRRCADAAAEAAADLAADRVIAWFEGRSEVGPRALGHRSILAHPGRAANWQRVNAIKEREAWRPFAPAVLDEAAGDWFSGIPHPSPYMLFTAKVESDALPAITHVDGTARVQTVGAESGGFRDVVAAFARLTGIPVVLNTSFNGPGEPIVEKPEEAIAFLLRAPLDALYLGGCRVTRRG